VLWSVGLVITRDMRSRLWRALCQVSVVAFATIRAMTGSILEHAGRTLQRVGF